MCVCIYHFSFVCFLVCVFCVQVWKQIRNETLPYKEKNIKKEKGELEHYLIFLRTQRKSENRESKKQKQRGKTTNREENKEGKRTREREFYGSRGDRDVWGVGRVDRERLCNTSPVYSNQVTSFHVVFLFPILLVYYPPSWVKYCKVICLVNPPNRVRIVAKAVALKLIYFQ